MNIVPGWLDFVEKQREAFRLTRRLFDPGVNPGEVVSSAQVILSNARDQYIQHPALLHDVATARPLTSAARILDDLQSYASTESPSASRNLALLAMIAYAGLGNFPNADAMSRAAVPSLAGVSPLLASIVGVCAPQRLGEALSAARESDTARSVLTKLNTFLDNGHEEQARMAQECLSALANAPSEDREDFEVVLSRYAALALRQVAELGTVKLVRSAGVALPSGYLQALQNDRKFTLLPPQKKALDQAWLSSEVAVLTLPTSTGKTLLGHMRLMASLADRAGVAIFIAPYRALARQVAGVFRRLSPPQVNVHSLTEVHADSAMATISDGQHIIVATPERFDSLTRVKPDLWSRIRGIVFDESHLIGSNDRGVQFDGLVTRLKLLRTNGLDCTAALMLPYPADPRPISNWLGGDAVANIADSWRATTKRLALWDQSGSLVWMLGDEDVRRDNERGDVVVGRKPLAWPEPFFRPPRMDRGKPAFADVAKARQQAYRNTAYLVTQLWNECRSPVLCVCSTKSGTRSLASGIAEKMEVVEQAPGGVARTIELIRTRYHYLEPLARCLAKGVAYHNAALPTDVRVLIEESCQRRQLKAVAATTTLAEGVDLPFRYTVVADWLMWNGYREEPMDSLLFHNIAGRCGRSGVYTEGDTIVFSNPAGAPEWANSTTRSETLRREFFSRGLKSIPSGAARLETESDAAPKIKAIMGAQFLAAIGENPGRDELAQDLAESTYWYSMAENRTNVKRVFTGIRNHILDDSEGALAVAASPLRLTPLGRTANLTGLSPSSARQLLVYLREVSERLTPAEYCAQLMERFAEIPEQGSHRIVKLFQSRSRTPVRPNELVDVFSRWMSGESLMAIFATLSKTVSSTVRPPVTEWLNGVAEPKWDEKFDAFYDLMNAATEVFLPWMCRACEFLKSHAQSVAVEVNWAEIGKQVQYGVDSAWAADVMSHDPPLDRQFVAFVGRRWPSAWRDEDIDPLGLTRIYVESSREQIEEFLRNCSTLAESEGFAPDEGTKLKNWLWSRVWR